MSSRLGSGLAVAVCGGLLAIACSGTITDDVFVGNLGAPPAFVEASDASVEAAPRELTQYCPSNKCPRGVTTCPTSKFLCDVDLRSDPNNCGACGVVCPRTSPLEEFVCIDGQCVLGTCRNDRFQDCDGVIDTGCETEVNTNEHCGACGNKCSDPETAPCQDQLDYNHPECGCPAPYTYCNPEIYGPGDRCRKLKTSDSDCGACGNKTNREGPPGAPPAPPNAYYGCLGGQPDQLKCEDGFDDCNNDLNELVSDGCETRTGTDENCIKCGDNCTAQGRYCAYDVPKEMFLACRCPTGQSYCTRGSTVFGSCADLNSDPNNCGACGVVCPGSTNTGRSRAVCDFGICKLACGMRWANCNGNVDDGCEVDIFSDPRNCGGCGITCDVASGQACAGGRCVVEPCKEGEESR